MKPKSNIHETKKSIVPVIFWFNAILLVVDIFYFKRWMLNLSLIVNFLFLGTYLIVDKYGYVFDGLADTKKFAKNLNNMVRVK